MTCWNAKKMLMMSMLFPGWNLTQCPVIILQSIIYHFCCIFAPGYRAKGTEFMSMDWVTNITVYSQCLMFYVTHSHKAPGWSEWPTLQWRSCKRPIFQWSECWCFPGAQEPCSTVSRPPPRSTSCLHDSVCATPPSSADSTSDTWPVRGLRSDTKRTTLQSNTSM